MSDDEHYSTIRAAEMLGSLIGRTVVDITQQDAEEFQEDGVSYVSIHFDHGVTVKFPIGDDGFEIEKFD